jgi:hypothetical protein
MAGSRGSSGADAASNHGSDPGSDEATLGID